MKGKEFRLYVTDDLHTRLKMLSAAEGKSMNRIINELIEGRIKKAVEEGKITKAE